MAYSNSDYSFSQPVRYYKANDPYYYEVDNIPVRQLEENILWVKDQVDSLLVPASAEPPTGVPLYVGDDLDLEHVKQFRPRSMGGRNITIQPGRFTARINDAFEVNDSLAQLTLAAVATITGISGDTLLCNDLPRFQQAQSVAFFDGVWDSYTKKLTDETFAACPGESNKALAYRANGLETMFTFYLSNDFGFNTLAQTAEGAPIPSERYTSHAVGEYKPNATGRAKTWPALWHGDFYNILSPILNTNWDLINQLHLKVVQHWRGVVRTSVVDFRGDTIQVPEFSIYDYFYVEEDSTGAETVTTLEDLATQRIDLLVIYSHPIDSSGTALAGQYPDASPTTQPGGYDMTVPGRGPRKIYEPRIGLIRGAGIGLKRENSGRIDTDDKRIVPGEQKILANLNDHLDGRSNTGIMLSNGSVIHGSFPSPDDLTNIAPNLTLSLADNSLQLVGQTAVPIAYVVVKKDSVSIVQEDIIDIRPFLRTTELAYNERAGVAAAQPPLSFANPAVGAAQMENQANCLRAYTDESISDIPPYYSNAYSNSPGIDEWGNSMFVLGETIVAMGYAQVELVAAGLIPHRSSGWKYGLVLAIPNIDVNGMTSTEILDLYSVRVSVSLNGGASHEGQFEGGCFLAKPAWESTAGGLGVETGEGEFRVIFNWRAMRQTYAFVNVQAILVSKGGFNAVPAVV